MQLFRKLRPALRALFILTAATAAATDSIPLAGEWRFALDPSAEQTQKDVPQPLPEGEGIADRWFARDLPDRIQLPGVLQAQGYGNEISPATPWMVTLGNAWWDLQAPELREVFSRPGHVEVPFLSQPPRHYLGVAWYQRDVEIPAAWKGRRLALVLEAPRWETTVWLDDQRFPAQDSLVAPHVHELGIATPGRHRLTVRIDNRRLIVDPKNDAHGLDAHAVSDALGATWNGVAGRIELISTSPVWIADAQVFPDPAKKSARIKVRIGNATGRAGSGQLSVGDRKVAVKWSAEGGDAEITVPLDAKAQPWDEFHPNLQHLTVKLAGPGADDAKDLTFGVRTVTWKDKELLVNGRPVNLRMTHFGGDFPLTGYPATDVESWRRIIKVCQDYGLNGIRFHSWCPPDAAFTAADELGFYLQPECGLWAPLNPDGIYTRRLEAETARLLQAYGNHPSFVMLSPSNEPGGAYVKVTPKWAADWYRKDDRRLFAAGTGWDRPEQVTGGPQYAGLVRFEGHSLRNETGWFGKDYRDALTNVHIPVLAHEVGQWCAYPDFDVIKEFTGYLRPSNYNIFKHIAAQEGVLEDNKALSFASGRFQLACYKEEIEANLRTPGLAGYQLLDLRDYLGQGTALIGFVDAFWNPKSYATAEMVRRFNNTTVPLARLEQRIFTTAEKLTVDAEIYHFGAQPIVGARPYWKIVDAAGKPVAQGEWPARDIPVGKNIPLGKAEADLAELPAPGAYRLVIGLKDTSVENDWNFWLYPAQIDPTVPADVLLTDSWPKARERLAQGGRVVFTPGADSLDPVKSPPMQRRPVFWNIQMSVRPPRNPAPKFAAFLGLLCDPAHPALAKFPTETNCDWQWTPLIENVPAVNLRGAPRELKPIVAAIDDWNRNWRLGVIFECKVGPGRLLVSAIPLKDAKLSGAQQLRRSLLDYAASPQFDPKVTLTPVEADKLWERGTGSTPATKRVFDPDMNDGTLRPTP